MERNERPGGIASFFPKKARRAETVYLRIDARFLWPK